MGGAEWFIVLLAMANMGMASSEPSLVDPCERHRNCGECIRDPTVCSWCAEDNFKGIRCKSKNLENWCGKSINPKNEISIEIAGNASQIVPHKFKLSIRPGLPTTFRFDFKAASVYPVDLYFLFDASKSMKRVKTTVENQTQYLYNTMKKLTSDIQMGVGTFIDKNTLPYTDKIDSEKTYSFKNHLKLTNDSKTFEEVVHKIKFGSNYDTPEGALDALAQVMSCRDQIGWRSESRKIVVLLTDGPYHSAGDGLIGGIYQPYDGKCYLDSAGLYTKELEMDYPSVSIIKKMAADEDITVIFIVNADNQDLYGHLSNAIGSGSKTVNYAKDPTKISNLLIGIYEEISKSLKLKVSVKSGQRNNFQIKFDPDCFDNSGPDCVVDQKHSEKHFNVTLTLLKYTGVNSTSVNVSIEGIGQKLTLDIEIIKECECEKDNIMNASICNNAGTLECGICKCDANRYGDKCACIKNSQSNANDNSTCKLPGDTELCNGHGPCICGNCICSKPYEGQYCQFNKDNCPRNDKGVCSGRGRGSCENEKCICTDTAWSGPVCECPTDIKLCTESNGKVCNGRGKCQCGTCVCDPTANWDAREHQDRFCNIEPCPDCVKPQCNLLEQCAVCLHYKNSPCEQCGSFKTNISEHSLPVSSDRGWNVCPDVRVDVGCYTRFMYRYDIDEYNIEIVVQSKKNCLESYYIYGAILLVPLILIGVATLVVWKWLTDAQDRREYEKFLKEHLEDISEPSANPTYRPASMTINNPAFRKPSVDFRN